MNGDFDLDADGLFINTNNFNLDKDGNAKFSGELEAATGTFAGDLIASGTVSYGNLDVLTVNGVETHTINGNSGKIADITHQDLNILAGVPYVKVWEDGTGEPSDYYWVCPIGDRKPVTNASGIYVRIKYIHLGQFIVRIDNDSSSSQTVKIKWKRAAIS